MKVGKKQSSLKQLWVFFFFFNNSLIEENRENRRPQSLKWLPDTTGDRDCITVCKGLTFCIKEQQK